MFVFCCLPFAGLLLFPKLASRIIVFVVRAFFRLFHILFAQVVHEALNEFKGLAAEITNAASHFEDTVISIAENQLFEIPLSPGPAPYPPTSAFYHPPVSSPDPPSHPHPSLWLAYFRGLETSAFLLCVLRLFSTTAPAVGQGPVGMAN